MCSARSPLPMWTTAMPESLRNTWIVGKREFAAYFATPIATVFLVIFVALTGAFAFYFGNFFERGQADLSTFFIYHPWLYLLLVPAIGMRLWAGAQERHHRAADDAAAVAVGGDPGQVPRRLVLHRGGADPHLPDVDHRQRAGPSRQRRDRRELP